MSNRSVLLPIIIITCRARAVSTFREKWEGREKCNDAYISDCTEVISHSNNFKASVVHPPFCCKNRSSSYLQKEKRNGKFSLLYGLHVGFIASNSFPSIPLTRQQKPKNQHMKKRALASLSKHLLTILKAVQFFTSTILGKFQL